MGFTTRNLGGASRRRSRRDTWSGGRPYSSTSGSPVRHEGGEGRVWYPPSIATGVTSSTRVSRALIIPSIRGTADALLQGSLALAGSKRSADSSHGSLSPDNLALGLARRRMKRGATTPVSLASVVWVRSTISASFWGVSSSERARGLSRRLTVCRVTDMASTSSRSPTRSLRRTRREKPSRRLVSQGPLVPTPRRTSSLTQAPTASVSSHPGKRQAPYRADTSPTATRLMGSSREGQGPTAKQLASSRSPLWRSCILTRPFSSSLPLKEASSHRSGRGGMGGPSVRSREGSGVGSRVWGQISPRSITTFARPSRRSIARISGRSMRGQRASLDPVVLSRITRPASTGTTSSGRRGLVA